MYVDKRIAASFIDTLGAALASSFSADLKNKLQRYLYSYKKRSKTGIDTNEKGCKSDTYNLFSAQNWNPNVLDMSILYALDVMINNVKFKAIQ